MDRSSCARAFVVAGLAFAGLVVAVPRAEAAALFFSPDSGNRIVGRSFSISVEVNAPDQAINAASGIMSFPADRLEIISISKAKSIINFWAEEPSFSNREGRVQFEGIVVNPGYQGAAGEVLTVTFRAKAEGRAALSFISGSVLANDGQGTNILQSLGNAAFAIERGAGGEPVPAPAPTIVAGEGALPNKPEVRTNPALGSDGWYNGDAVEFAWALPPGVDSVSHAISQDAGFDLPKTDKGLAAAATYDFRETKNGTWHFFVRFHNKNGWGPVARAPFKIDRTPPEEFAIRRLDADDPTNPQPVFEWGTEDKDSGIERYDIKIGSGDWFSVEPSTYNRYILPSQLPTKSGWIFIRAHDRAGNMRKAMLEFGVAPIEMPTVNEFTDTIAPPDKPFVANGEALPNSRVVVFLRKGNKTVSFEAKVSSRGLWSIEYGDRIPSGTWQFTAQTTDFRGAWSEETEPRTVKATGTWRDIVRMIFEWGLVILGALFVLAAVAAIGYFVVYRFMAWRVQLKRELEKVRAEVRADLTSLEAELAKHPERASDLVKKEMQKIDTGLEEEVKRVESFRASGEEKGKGPEARG